MHALNMTDCRGRNEYRYDRPQHGDPGKSVEFKHDFAEGELVILPYYQRWPHDHDWDRNGMI
jgi:hypothetical protein